MMAAEAVKLICGVGEPLLGRLQVFDALEATWRTVRVRPPSPRPVRVTHLADYEALCGVGPAVTDSTGSTDRGDSGTEGISAPELAQLLRDRDAGLADFVLVDV